MWGLTNTPRFSPARVVWRADSTARGEDEGHYFILMFILFTLLYSRTGTQTTPELQALLCCMKDAARVPGLRLD